YEEKNDENKKARRSAGAGRQNRQQPAQPKQTKRSKEKRMAAVNVRPLGDRVLVQPLEEQEMKKGGIIIPDTAKEKPQEGKVVALGTGKIDDNGKKIDFTVKKGDKVLISKYGGTEIKIDDQNDLIMREHDIRRTNGR